MTVAAAVAKAGPYPGNDSASVFPFTFKIFDDTDVRVVETIAGIDTDLVLNSGFSVAANADQDVSPGGTFTYLVGGVPTALPSGKTLTAIGDFDFDQPTDIPNGGPFFASTIENALDRGVMQAK